MVCGIVLILEGVKSLCSVLLTVVPRAILKLNLERYLFLKINPKLPSSACGRRVGDEGGVMLMDIENTRNFNSAKPIIDLFPSNL